MAQFPEIAMQTMKFGSVQCYSTRLSTGLEYWCAMFKRKKEHFNDSYDSKTVTFVHRGGQKRNQ